MEQAPLCAFFFFLAFGGCSTTFIAASNTPLTFCKSEEPVNYVSI
jgi:hypothetical protein